MTSVRVWSFLFGIIFVAIGVAGFMPMFMTDDKLLGIFQVDAMHNIVHLVSGVVALLAAMSSAVYSRLYFRIFGLIYGVIAIAGFIYGSQMETMMHMNMADHMLHLVIAIVALYIGFTTKIPAQ
jgi:hypothetical protein